MDLIRRIRWVNVARAAAVLGVVALIFAWPTLRADPPSLPPAPAQADVPRETGPEFGVEPVPRARTRPAKPHVTKPRVRAKPRPRPRPKRSRTHERRRPKPAAPARPAPPVTAPGPAPVGPPAPAPAAASEFGFE